MMLSPQRQNLQSAFYESTIEDGVLDERYSSSLINSACPKTPVFEIRHSPDRYVGNPDHAKGYKE
jgi:hypothetical protein